jgi:protein-S-isoprenylcysteine O-methyltransferase Ste14
MTLALKIPPVALVLIFAALMYCTSQIFPAFNWENSYKMAGLLCATLLGCIIALTGVIEFRRQQTTVNPHKPQNASQLVTTGIYRVSRNPMYLGLLLCLIGWSFCLANLLTLPWLAVFCLYINHYQIKPEEAMLNKLFGSAYSSYKKQVRRWL